MSTAISATTTPPTDATTITHTCGALGSVGRRVAGGTVDRPETVHAEAAESGLVELKLEQQSTTVRLSAYHKMSAAEMGSDRPACARPPRSDTGLRARNTRAPRPPVVRARCEISETD